MLDVKNMSDSTMLDTMDQKNSPLPSRGFYLLPGMNIMQVKEEALAQH